jgi:hypothetical protein
MSTDDQNAAAIRRLINLWIRNRVESSDAYDVPLREVLRPENIEWVAKLDLFRDHDAAIAWDKFRTRELVRQWLRERAAGEEAAMRYLTIALIGLWLMLGPAPAQPAYRCPGFTPHPPVGCKGPPRCLCDADGRCGWVFACDEN